MLGCDHQQYRRFRRPEDEYTKNPAQEGWRFAITAVSAEIKEKRRKWSWPYFAERRDDRNRYVSLFQRKLIGSLPENVCFINFFRRKENNNNLFS